MGGFGSTTQTHIDSEHTQQLLTCGHKTIVETALIAAYPTAFCARCQDVRGFAKRSPSRRPIR